MKKKEGITKWIAAAAIVICVLAGIIGVVISNKKDEAAAE